MELVEDVQLRGREESCLELQQGFVQTGLAVLAVQSDRAWSRSCWQSELVPHWRHLF